jgi:hypothetical protein
LQVLDTGATLSEDRYQGIMTTYEDAVAGHAYSTLMRLGLPAYTIHFKSSTYMRESSLEMLDRKVCKNILKASAQQPEVRLVQIIIIQTFAAASY